MEQRVTTHCGYGLATASDLCRERDKTCRPANNLFSDTRADMNSPLALQVNGRELYEAAAESFC